MTGRERERGRKGDKGAETERKRESKREREKEGERERIHIAPDRPHFSPTNTKTHFLHF